MSTHIADSFIIACIDFRFQKYIQKWLSKNMKGKQYDYVGFAGVTKDIKTFMNQLDISVRLHHIKQVVLIHHEDCGAYGKLSTHERHVKDLNKAKKTVLKKFPQLKVKLLYLHLNGKFEEIKK